jgi:tetratricopeptide (TPR) repeat protein
MSMQMKFGGEFALMKEHLEAAFARSNAPLKWGSMPTEPELYVLLTDSAAEQRDESALREFAPILEELASRNGHKLYEAVAHRASGVAHTIAGEYTQAQARLEQSLALLRALDTRWQIGRTLYEFGDLASRQGDLPSARAYFSQALAHYEELRAAPYVERTRSRQALVNQ